MNKELIKNLNDYFDTYKESIRMLESGNKERSTYPSYGHFYRIKDIVKEIATKNGLYLDTHIFTKTRNLLIILLLGKN